MNEGASGGAGHDNCRYLQRASALGDSFIGRSILVAFIMMPLLVRVTGRSGFRAGPFPENGPHPEEGQRNEVSIWSGRIEIMVEGARFDLEVADRLHQKTLFGRCWRDVVEALDREIVASSGDFNQGSCLGIWDAVPLS